MSSSVTITFPKDSHPHVALPNITTPRLLLLPLPAVDLTDASNGVVDGLHAMRSQFPVMRWTRQGDVDKDRQQSLDWVLERQRRSKQCPSYAVQLLEAGTGPGASSRTTIGSLGIVSDSEVGFMLHGDHHSKGYATEAAPAFIEAFWQFTPSTASTEPAPPGARQPCDFVSAIVSCRNWGSIAIVKKSGFTKVRHYEEDGQAFDEWKLARPGTGLGSITEDALHTNPHPVL